jgi:hypothetical protein
MNNVLFDIQGDSNRSLDSALNYLETVEEPKGYAVAPRKGLVLFWNSKAGKVSVGFPENGVRDYPENLKNLLYFELEVSPFPIPWKDFIKSWVLNNSPDEFDLDFWEKDRMKCPAFSQDIGMAVKGFHMYGSRLGGLPGSPYSYGLVRPIFIWYSR